LSAAIQDILAELQGLPPGEVVFDLDGTLIDGDCGESALRRLRPGAWQAYLDQPTYREQCVFAAEQLAGFTRRELDRVTDQAFAEGELAPIPAACELVAALSERHRVWILTGSAEVLGEAVAPRVGVGRVLGLRLGWDGDRLRGPVREPATCGEGKVTAVWAWLGRRPLFAMGDTAHDLPLLRMARFARTCGRHAGVEFPAFPT
jgi:HAD superfamily phosphoserine phosphatase-like hydrolase